MGRRTIEGWPARVSGWSIDAENICSRALLQLLRAAIGTDCRSLRHNDSFRYREYIGRAHRVA
jgi:hypothetical protein